MKMGRRGFISRAGQIAIGAALAAPRGASAMTRSANERVTVAHIGVGGMGNAHIDWFANLPDVDVAAVCDVDETHLDAALEHVRKLRPGRPLDGYRDFRRVLERDDIDAITCATPDHWHALIAVSAFEAGKDVYSEKPLSRTLAESHAMVRSRQRNGRVFQLGTQIHEGENYHRVVEIVRSGVLGKIHTVRLWKTGGSPGLGWPRPEDPPATLDWEMWQGPAPSHPYVPQRCHFTFRYFWDYSGGNYADFWCHIADLAFWALELGQPTTVSARGETPTDGIADTPAWIDVDYDFDGLKVLWTTSIPDVPGAAGRGIGCQFEGTEGSLVADYGDRVIFIGGEELKDIAEVPQTLPRSPGHQRHFIDCVKSRAQTESHLDYVHNMTLPMHLGCASFRLRRPLRWDSATQQCVGDEAANWLLARPHRAPWVLPA